MMLGASNDAVSTEQPHESGGASGGSSGTGVMDESERSGNRWPRQETLALLKIRSDMDVAFRDSSLKGPLWEEVSRKMAELGFQRSAKKCKEKFENVFKYHKRTKDGRASKPDGKSYRFFDQLEALENSPPISFAPPPRAMAAPPNTASANIPMPQHISTVSSTSPNPLSVAPPPNTLSTQTSAANNLISSSIFQPTMLQPPPPPSQINPTQVHSFQPSHPHVSNSQLSNSTSSSTSSDEDIQRRRGKKRKWKDFFGKLMKDVIQKQEELQNKFLETLERRERDRNAREEAWRVQEMARMNREHDLLVQERSIAAAKDSAVIAFLQKVTDQHNLQIPINNSTNAAPAPQAPMQIVQQPQQQPQQPHAENPPQPPPRKPPPPPSPRQINPISQAPAPAPAPTPPILTMVTPTKTLDITKTDNNGDGFTGPSSSRWPKSEVEALIKLRTNLEIKYQENGPKGPLWEEISSAMSKLGYNRSSKRCKEKWENINKYFKKVKESNKKRPEDSKTCPYFHQLDAIYKERAKTEIPSFNYSNPMVPIMAQPEQQWPLLPDQQQQQQQQHDSVMHDNDSDDNNDDHEDEDEGDDDEDEDDDQGGGYEIVTNKQPSSVTNAVE